MIIPSIRRQALNGRLTSSCNRNAHFTNISAKSVPFSSNRSVTTSDIDPCQGFIGFIGLGCMGYPMALNVLHNYQIQLNSSVSENKRVEVYLLDVAPGRAKQLMKEFASKSNKSNSNEVIAIEAESIGHLASRCSTIITMLPNTSHVIETMTCIEGVLKHAKKGYTIENIFIVIDISPSSHVSSTLQLVHHESMTVQYFAVHIRSDTMR